MKKFLFLVLPIIFLLLFLSVQNSNCQLTDSSDIELRHDSLLNKKLPFFSGTSISGQNWNPERLNGKVVLINFWFIGCAPCMKEIKFLNNIYSEFKGKDFILLSIAPQVKDDLINFNSEVNNNIPAAIRIKMNAEKIIYEVIPACDKKKNTDPTRVGPECKNISSNFLVDGYPTTFFIDKAGIIRYVEEGFPTSDAEAENKAERYREMIINLLKK